MLDYRALATAFASARLNRETDTMLQTGDLPTEVCPLCDHYSFGVWRYDYEGHRHLEGDFVYRWDLRGHVCVRCDLALGPDKIHLDTWRAMERLDLEYGRPEKAAEWTALMTDYLARYGAA